MQRVYRLTDSFDNLLNFIIIFQKRNCRVSLNSKVKKHKLDEKLEF